MEKTDKINENEEKSEIIKKEDEIVKQDNGHTLNSPENKANSNKKQEIIQMLKFLGFSISAGVIQLGLFEILYHAIGWLYWPSYLISLVASVIWNFTFNRKFTFKSANNVPIAMTLVLVFYAVFTPLSTLWGDALVGIGWNGTLVTVLNMVINFITEYLFDRFVVFRKSINTQQVKEKKEKTH